MQQITSLTKEQKEQLAKWREEWFLIGSSTNRINRDKTRANINKVYEILVEEKPQIIFVDSPLSAIYAKAVLKNRTSLVDSLMASLVDSLKASLEASLGVSLRASLRASLMTSLVDSLMASLVDSLKASLEASLMNSLKNEYVWPHIEGPMDSYWVAFYKFCEHIGVVYNKTKSEHLSLWADLCKNGGPTWCYKNIAIVSDNPESICWAKGGVEEKRIHCDGGPAVKYKDGWAIWALNGVRVPKWLAETKESDIDPAKISEINNVEIRREFIRKVGVERIYQKLGGETIDRDEFENISGSHKYELVTLHISDSEWGYLKMENPTLRGIYHMEGVPNQCENVKQALNFRNGLTEKMIDDENGAEWYQQGDVIMRPKGATKYRRFPTLLT